MDQRHHEAREPRRYRSAESQHDPIDAGEPAKVCVVDEHCEPARGPADDRKPTDLVGQSDGEVRSRGIRHQRRESTLTSAGRPPTRSIARSRIVDKSTSQIDRRGNTPFVIDADTIVSAERVFATRF
jgi:hypothetical protein